MSFTLIDVARDLDQGAVNWTRVRMLCSGPGRTTSRPRQWVSRAMCPSTVLTGTEPAEDASRRAGEDIQHASEGDTTTRTPTMIDTQVVVLGVDTHQRTHHAAIVAADGPPLADREFPATSSGYRHVERRSAEHKTKKDIIRCLKRYVAPEVFNDLTTDLGRIDKL